jgi:hypothetical protein
VAGVCAPKFPSPKALRPQGPGRPTLIPLRGGTALGWALALLGSASNDAVTQLKLVQRPIVREQITNNQSTTNEERRLTFRHCAMGAVAKRQWRLLQTERGCSL